MRKGFTLIELVVAIAILGVLMIIAIPSVKNIQNSNHDKKYEVYEKAITNSSKLYVDAYSEDLFGVSNTGCAVIKYDDLKVKDLIEDIQLKNTNCNDPGTCVRVKKDKNGSYHYETNIVCKENGNIVFKDGDSNCSPTSCALEDGYGPDEEIVVTPEKSTYYLGDNPKFSIRISDVGIGLKENQFLTYQWFKGSDSITDEKIVYFKNKNYVSSIARSIDVPNLENIDEPTNYSLKVTGNLYDVDNNKTLVNDNKSIKYFVGALLIQMKAGGASMASQHHPDYKIDSSDYIYHGTNDRVISKIKYKGQADLWNYNNKDWINISKSDYHIDSKKEWKYNNNEYDQTKNYKISDFNYTDEDVKKENKTITVTANWKMNKPKKPVVTITSPGSGSFKTNGRGQDWTNTTVTYKVNTDSSSSIVGYWYTKYTKYQLTYSSRDGWKNNVVSRTDYSKYSNTTGKVEINPSNVSCSSGREVNIAFYYKVCNKVASGVNDTSNCSDETEKYIRIDKKRPTYVFTYVSGNPGIAPWAGHCYKHYYKLEQYDTGSGIGHRDGTTSNPPASVTWNEDFSGLKKVGDTLAGCNNSLTVTLNKLCDIVGNCTTGLPSSRSCYYGNSC